jgi:hypothetical protein
LRFDNLSLAHIAREFEPIPLGIVVATHRCDIEPLVSFDEIDRPIASRATAETELKKGVVLIALSCIFHNLTRGHVQTRHFTILQ